MVRMKDLVKGNIENSSNSLEDDNLIFRDVKPKSAEVEAKEQRVDNKIIYKKACFILKKVEKEIKDNSTFDVKDCFLVAKNIVSSLKIPLKATDENSLGSKAQSLTYIAIKGFNDPPFDDLIVHTLNVAIYSVKIGMELKYDKESLLKLCLSALLHDIGMLKIPGAILKKRGKLTEDEMKIVRKHPRYSFDIIKTLGDEYTWLAEIVRQEHERFDGSGYPHGLTKNEIHEFAIIIGVTDVFEAMTHIRPYKKAQMPFLAVKNIIRSRNKAFEPKVIKGLLRGLSIFPVGTFVRLNSKEIGKVIFVDERAPLRPILEILYDSQGNQTSNRKRIDLRRDALIFISNVLSDQEDIEAIIHKS